MIDKLYLILRNHSYFNQIEYEAVYYFMNLKEKGAIKLLPLIANIEPIILKTKVIIVK